MREQPKLFFLYGFIILAAAAAPAAQQRRQPAASEYIKILEDPHRVERLKPQEIIKTLALKPGDIVADIGSGSGLFARPMAQAVGPSGRVYAVDVDKELLAHVAKTAREQGISNISTVLGSNDSPALPESSVDVAFVCDTLHHIENRQTYLTNVRPSLKPDGRLVIIDFLDSWPSGHESMKYSLDDLDRWAAAAGFAKVAEYNSVPGNFFRTYAVAVATDQPISVAYFYRVKWGHQDEFLELFKKNHYPLLEARVKSGRMVKVEAYTPRFHGDGRSDWTFMTVLVFKNWQAFGDNSGEQELIRKMYPDQEKFKKEEQARFEILDAHWDVPLTPAPMK